eukprot:SAG31_NODE_177_length_21310_cov_8.894064_15_plen_58_part_00
MPEAGLTLMERSDQYPSALGCTRIAVSHGSGGPAPTWHVTSWVCKIWSELVQYNGAL